MNKFLKLLPARKNEHGFTLIELLVVIGILGILAAALIATIDPFEQLKKANDANIKNTAVEFVNANIRYFTTHNEMAWNIDSNCSSGTAPTGGAGVGGAITSGDLGGASMKGCLTDLVADGEIKAAFTTATGLLTSIAITGGSDSVTACFLPTSKSGQRDQNARYTASGTFPADTTTCLGATNAGGGATACYWCSL